LWVNAILGNRKKAMETIERALLIDPDNMTLSYDFACILAGYLCEVDASLHLLEQSLAGANIAVINTARVDPDLDALRNSPRFQNILAEAQRRLNEEV